MTIDLRTTYLGMELANPLVPSASPLSRDLDMARRLEDAGAAALVMYSLFEEELARDQETFGRLLHHQALGHGEASSFLPAHGEPPGELDRYLEQLSRLKGTLDIPVVASLNGVTLEAWIQHGKELQEAGADALELNIYHVAADPAEDAAAVERRYTGLLSELRHHVSLPIAMKLSPFFSSPGNLVKRLEQGGAAGVALFNRFYQPDIDLDSRQVAPRLHLSDSGESLLAMRWIAILHGRVDLTLAATGGVHSAMDALKMLFAGADVVHMCSALLKRGPAYLGQVLSDMITWLEESGYESLEQIQGVLSQQHTTDPAAFERANYVRMLEGYSLR